MSPEEKTKIADDVAHSLQGTCMETIESQIEARDLPPELGDDMDFLLMIDDRVFRCSCCDWWCETSELADADDQLCMDCDD